MAAVAMEATEQNISVLSPASDDGAEKQEASAAEPAISSVNLYRMEWLGLVSSLGSNQAELRDLAFEGDLKSSKFRSVAWSLLLRVLNDDPSVWAKQREQQRNRYEKLKLEFAKNPYEAQDQDLSNDDPLSQSKQSLWNQYFGDQELFAVIKQDVVRTFPGVEFFRKPAIQAAMTNILFYYAREHPYMCYRQGMHEILAPILFVMFSDHQSLQHFLEITDQIDKLLLVVLDPAYLEADSYALFSRLMSSIESYYRITNLVPTAEGYFPPQRRPVDPCNDPYDGNTEVEVISQLNFIRDKILIKEDLHLHNRFLKLEIPLHIFGIRWLRLLFGREFALMDLLMIWDAIFADSDRFELPNYILVAMLIRIREKLLLTDYTTCLTHLMRYPTNVDVGLVLRHALHMYLPKKFDRPPHAFVYINTQPPAKAAALVRKGSDARPQTNGGRMRTTSVGNESFSDKRAQSDLKELQYKYAKQSARLAKLKSGVTGDRVIIDGISENSPELIALELQNAQTVISVTKLKLRKYLKTIRKHVTHNQPEELTQAVEGIEELCEFLDVKFSMANSSISQQVDQALEANENGQILTPPPYVEVALASPNTLQNGHDHNSSMANGTRYEIPDNGFMANSSKILGNRTDVELKLFKEERDRGLPPSADDGVPNIDPVGYRHE